MAMLLAAALVLAAKGGEPRETKLPVDEFIVTAFKPDLAKRTVTIVVTRNLPRGERLKRVSVNYVLREGHNYPGFYGDGKIDCSGIVPDPICSGPATATITARLMPLCASEMAPPGQPIGCAIKASDIEAWVELIWLDSTNGPHKLHFHPKPK